MAITRPTKEHVRKLAGLIDTMEAEINTVDAEYRDAVARGDATAAGVTGERFEYLLADYERLVDKMSGSTLWPDTVAELRERANGASVRR